MAGIRQWFDREAELLKLRRENKQLLQDVERLRLQNESMRGGMRRCITCDYRLQAKARKGPEWRDELDTNPDTD